MHYIMERVRQFVQRLGEKVIGPTTIFPDANHFDAQT